MAVTGELIDQYLNKPLEKYRVDVLTSTVCRKLINAGLPAHYAHKKVKITTAMAEKRINWEHNVKSQISMTGVRYTSIISC